MWALLLIAALAAEPDEPAVLYAEHCASCHGDEGDGEGPVGTMLRPRPAAFADPAFWTDERTDARLLAVVLKGGESVGLSPTMAAWRSELSRAEARGLVAWIRERWAPVEEPDSDPS